MVARGWRLNQLCSKSFVSSSRFTCSHSVSSVQSQKSPLYFPRLLGLLPGGETYGNNPSIYTSKAYGVAFDHKSIMLYGYNSGAEAPNPNDKST